MHDNLGIAVDVVEEDPAKVRFRCRQCPLCERGLMAGLDNKIRESMCRAGPLRFTDAILKQLDPKLTHQLLKYRSGPADSCEEQIVLA
jgi:hypothetical protein